MVLYNFHFRESCITTTSYNTKLSIKGYDHVAYKGSQVIDIALLPDKDESIDICICSPQIDIYNKLILPFNYNRLK